jgi:hypothetical protein
MVEVVRERLVDRPQAAVRQAQRQARVTQRTSGTASDSDSL